MGTGLPKKKTSLSLEILRRFAPQNDSRIIEIAELVPSLSRDCFGTLSLAKTKGDVIASRRRGNPGGRVLLGDCFVSNTPRKDMRLV